MIKVTKQYKDEPGLLKFAYFFKNAITVNEIFKFLKKIKIVTRNWLQNSGKTENKKMDKRIEKGKK
jgi:hypothetical protein